MSVVVRNNFFFFKRLVNMSSNRFYSSAVDNTLHKDDGHHELFHGVPVDPNPGPPITFDYFPVPCQPFKPVYDELQRKFNLYLLGGISFFLFSLYVLYATDGTDYESWASPQSYRDRKRINAELRAKEAAGNNTE